MIPNEYSNLKYELQTSGLIDSIFIFIRECDDKYSELYQVYSEALLIQRLSYEFQKNLPESNNFEWDCKIIDKYIKLNSSNLERTIELTPHQNNFLTENIRIYNKIEVDLPNLSKQEHFNYATNYFAQTFIKYFFKKERVAFKDVFPKDEEIVKSKSVKSEIKKLLPLKDKIKFTPLTYKNYNFGDFHQAFQIN